MKKIGWAKTRKDNSVIYGSNSVLTIVECKITTHHGQEREVFFEIFIPLIAPKNSSVISEVSEDLEVFIHQSWIVQAKEEQIALKEGFKLVEILGMRNDEEEENEDDRRPGTENDEADSWPHGAD